MRDRTVGAVAGCLVLVLMAACMTGVAEETAADAGTLEVTYYFLPG
jgi:hypothetical protein